MPTEKPTQRGARRRLSPTECLHAVGGHVYCCQGRRVTTRDEKNRVGEMSLIREGQLCTTANELIDLTAALKDLEERRNAGSAPQCAATPSGGAAAGGRSTTRKWLRLPLKEAPPLSDRDKEAQRQLMDRLGIEFWEGPQITLYETWPLEVVRCGRNSPEHYAYWPSWEHKVLKHTCGCLRYSLHWRRYPCRRDGFVPMWMFCLLPPWVIMPCRHPGFEGALNNRV